MSSKKDPPIPPIPIFPGMESLDIEPPKFKQKQDTNEFGVKTLQRTGTKHAVPHSKAKQDIDKAVSVEDWFEVYRAFSKAGDPQILSSMTGLDYETVDYLLTDGIARLGMPPIRDYAVDPKEVADRIIKLGLDPENMHQKMLNPPVKALPPEHQELITTRAAREVTAAQALLAGTMENAALFFDMVRQINNEVKQNGVTLPEEITPNLIMGLATAGEKIAKTMDAAIRVARLTAGEPEQTISVEIAHILETIPEDEIVRFAKQGQLPPSLRGRQSSRSEDNPVELGYIDAEYDESKDDE